MSEEIKTPPPEKKKMNLGVRIVMAIIGAVFLVQGVNQMRSGMSELKNDTPKIETKKIDVSSSASGKVVKDERSKLSVTFPSDWVVKEGEEESQPFNAAPSKGPSDFRVSKENVPENCTPRQYVDAMNRLLKENSKINDFTILSDSKVTVAGLEGIRQNQKLKMAVSDVNIRQVSTVFIKDKAAYCAIASSTEDEFQSMEPTFLKIVESIKFE